jgi:glycosyltransferase involved in cell wall biosynthesis
MSTSASSQPSSPGVASLHQPSIDVVIPTRDRPELLRRAIDAALDQDYSGPVRVIVVFDGAPADQTYAQSGDRRSVIVIDNTRKPGLAGARNSGIETATADLVAFCDDDDSWLPSKLTAQRRALRANPEAVLASCGIRIHYSDHVIDRTLGTRTVTLDDLLRDRLTELHPSTFLMRRRAIVDYVGLVEEDLPGSYAEDYEFLLRVARRAPIVTTAQVGVDVLWHAESYFDSRWPMIIEALTWLLARYPEFSRQRAGEARIDGQIAFASAAIGQRREAVSWAARAVRRNPAERRAYLALAVASGALSPDKLIQWLHRRGRGI